MPVTKASVALPANHNTLYIPLMSVRCLHGNASAHEFDVRRRVPRGVNCLIILSDCTLPVRKKRPCDVFRLHSLYIVSWRKVANSQPQDEISTESNENWYESDEQWMKWVRPSSSSSSSTSLSSTEAASTVLFSPSVFRVRLMVI